MTFPVEADTHRPLTQLAQLPRLVDVIALQNCMGWIEAQGIFAHVRENAPSTAQQCTGPSPQVAVQPEGPLACHWQL